MSPRDITIAITVYDRASYVMGAIDSALNQCTSARSEVIVVEDCGPNDILKGQIVSRFGDKIRYFRNSRRRGLFDNWNACIEVCRTPWLCVLHDDDLLEPMFSEAMIKLSETKPTCALYFGRCEIINGAGQRVGESHASNFSSNDLSLEDWARYDPVCFPGQLFNVAAAREAGGFRASSHYTADWEMWFKLTLAHGSAATNRIVAKYREHHLTGRGTTKVDVSGRKYACINMQRKRHVAWLREKGKDSRLRFDRRALQAYAPMPARFILEHGRNFSPRMLRYNAGLLNVSAPPHVTYRLLQWASRLLTWRSLRYASLFLQSFHFPRNFGASL